MLRITFLLVATACLCSAKTLWHQLDGYSFEAFKREYGRSYTGAEHTRRQAIFERNFAKIQRHNAAGKSWKEGVNHMADWSVEEFKDTLGYRKDIGYMMHKEASLADGANFIKASGAGSTFPKSIDWRTHDVVTSVKDQGQCGSCWSFATAETLESHHALKTGVLPVLSEQNVLACVPNPKQCGGTGGCQGGTAELAYATLAKTGIASEWTYPYTSYFGKNDKSCATGEVVKAAANLTGYSKIPSNQYEPLMAIIGNIGPVAISVEAMHWQFYEDGVFDGCNQTNPDIDHAVQLVGYGTETESGDNYWLVRNSWSPAWGAKGYIKIARTAKESTRCGTDITPLDGDGCAGGPKTQKVCGTCGILFDNCIPTLV